MGSVLSLQRQVLRVTSSSRGTTRQVPDCSGRRHYRPTAVSTSTSSSIIITQRHSEVFKN